MKQPSLLVVLAHPDDESFAIGGTLAKYAAEGINVVLVCATRGEAGLLKIAPLRAQQIRSSELLCAAEKLRLHGTRFLGYRDGFLSDEDDEKMRAILINLMQEYSPQVIITFGPEGISGHPDHKKISRRVTQAFDGAGLAQATRLYYIAPSTATFQGCGVMPAQDFTEGAVASVDITDYRLAKVYAVQCHASQNPPFTGNPAEAAEKIACHEYFILARPAIPMPEMTDLFQYL